MKSNSHDPQTKNECEQRSAPTRPRILVVITKADVGGAQMHVLQIIRELGARFEFVLATGATDFLTRQVEALGVRVEILPDLVRPIRPGKDLAATRALYRLIREVKPDLVHAHSFNAGLLARIAALAARTPCLFTAHGWAFTPGAPAGQRLIGFALESILCRLCAGVVTISRHDYDLARRWRVGSNNKRWLVLNAADPASVQATPATAGQQLLTIGRLTPVKNQHFLLDVVGRLPETYTLQIIGEGPERESLTRHAAQLGVTERVQFSGELVDISNALADAGVFVLGSNFEGLPLSILEAMSAGLPVISTDVGGVREAVMDGETGLLVARGDAEGFAQAIVQIQSRPDWAGSMGRAGLVRYRQHFSISRFRTEMESVYCQLLR